MKNSISLISSLLTILTFFFQPDFLVNLIKENPKITLTLIVLLIAVIIFILENRGNYCLTYHTKKFNLLDVQFNYLDDLVRVKDANQIDKIKVFKLDSDIKALERILGNQKGIIRRRKVNSLIKGLKIFIREYNGYYQGLENYSIEKLNKSLEGVVRGYSKLK